MIGMGACCAIRGCGNIAVAIVAMHFRRVTFFAIRSTEGRENGGRGVRRLSRKIQRFQPPQLPSSSCPTSRPMTLIDPRFTINFRSIGGERARAL
jgi:hypothetical protein